MKKRAQIVGLFYHPDLPSRVQMVYDYLNEKFYTEIITSDFHHFEKKYNNNSWTNCKKIHVPSYGANFSPRRILSHIVYARRIRKVILSYEPDLLYVIVPPNFSAYRAVKIAKRHNIFVIVDIVDVWPNANAPQNFFTFYFYMIWNKLRDYAVKHADKVVLECANYSKHVEGRDYHIIPLSKKNPQNISSGTNDGKLRIAYLGAFSTSYDFDSLIKIAIALKEKPCIVVLIGDGNEKPRVIKMIEEGGGVVEDHGTIYSEAEKNNILVQCDFGYNGFASEMIVGQSFKSLDYMSVGLPLLNTLKGELWQVVERHQAGLNFTPNSIDDMIDKMKMIAYDDIRRMKDNTKAAFKNYYGWERYESLMDNVIGEL